MTDPELIKQTHDMVLYVYQEWPRVWATVVKLESRVTALEVRPVPRIPSRKVTREDLDQYESPSGTYDLKKLLEQHYQAEAAETWGVVKKSTGKVLLAVACAVAVAMTFALGGVLLAQGRAPTVVSPH